MKAAFMFWWMNFRHASLQWWICLDQFANSTLSLLFPRAWAGTWADETLSCRAWRMYRDGKPWGRVFCPLFDWMFAWQALPEGASGHCEGAYMKEMGRYNFPPEKRP